MKSLSFVLYKNVWKDFRSEPVGFHCISIDLVGCQVIFLSGMVAMILLRTLHRAWGMVCVQFTAKASFSKGFEQRRDCCSFACQETLQSTMTWMQMTPARTPTSQSQDLGKFGSTDHVILDNLIIFDRKSSRTALRRLDGSLCMEMFSENLHTPRLPYDPYLCQETQRIPMHVHGRIGFRICFLELSRSYLRRTWSVQQFVHALGERH